MSEKSIYRVIFILRCNINKLLCVVLEKYRNSSPIVANDLLLYSKFYKYSDLGGQTFAPLHKKTWI